MSTEHDEEIEVKRFLEPVFTKLNADGYEASEAVQWLLATHPGTPEDDQGILVRHHVLQRRLQEQLSRRGSRESAEPQ
jgi:hypothetical protein